MPAMTTTSASRQREHLRRLFDLSKTASIGGDQETQFEQALASLGFTQIRDKAPRLMDYLLGFQLVERDNDNTRSVGVFGFQAGKTLLLMPLFFLNGEVKGHDLLYVRDKDMFVPMNEKWVDHLLRNEDDQMGLLEDPAESKQYAKSIDFRQLSETPYGGKFASDKSVPVFAPVYKAGWAEPFRPFAPIMASLTLDSLDKTAGYLLRPEGLQNTSGVVEYLLHSSPAFCGQVLKMAEAYPVIGDAFYRHHGKDALTQGLTQQKVALDAQAVSPLLAAPAAAPQEAAKVALFEQGIADLSQMTTDELVQMFDRGYAIRDKRAAAEKAMSYRTESPLCLDPVTASGVYNVYMRDGQMEKCVVLVGGETHNGGSTVCVVRRVGGREYARVRPSRVLVSSVTDFSPATAFKSWLTGVASTRDLGRGGVYVAVAPDGTWTGPFRYRHDTNEGDGYYVHFCDYPGPNEPDTFTDTPLVSRPRSPGGYDVPEVIRFDDVDTVQRTLSGVVIPKKAKIIALANPYPERDADGIAVCDSDSPDERDPENLDLGDLATFQAQVKGYLDPVKLAANGPRNILIDQRGPFHKEAAIVELMVKHAMSEDDAEDAVKTVLVRRQMVVQVCPPGRCDEIASREDDEDNEDGNNKSKTASPLIDLTQGLPSIGLPDKETGGYDVYSQAPVVEPYSDIARGEPLAQSRSRQDQFAPLPDPLQMQQLQRAAATGQKEVFDTAMLGSMARSVWRDSHIDSKQKDLLKALDSLGRLLFLYYWHGDEFAERYGETDMPELEDALRNSFESLGVLVLFLRQREVRPVLSVADSATDLDNIT